MRGFAAGAAALAGLVALAGAARPASGVAQEGREIFEGKGGCAVCHGPGGTGTRMAPDLTDGEWLHVDGSYEAIRALVKAGVPEPKEAPVPMPAAASLGEGELSAVARYVHELGR